MRVRSLHIFAEYFIRSSVLVGALFVCGCSSVISPMNEKAMEMTLYKREPNILNKVITNHDYEYVRSLGAREASVSMGYLVKCMRKDAAKFFPYYKAEVSLSERKSTLLFPQDFSFVSVIGSNNMDGTYRLDTKCKKYASDLWNTANE